MRRDVNADMLRNGLREGYRRNGYEDSDRIDRFLAALTGTLPKGGVMWIVYDSREKKTRLIVADGSTTVIEGSEFMRATWSIWFRKSKPADLGDALIGNL